ncbi:MAG: helix-turn-helix transcriptional regulator [Bacteroidetes bacterium]|nr:helix-turn-helix transcriptional regulator [Bacteroidota bacterium]
MQHLLPLYLILCILPGIAALTVLSALVTRFRNRGLTYYLIAYSCFTVSILINLVMFYLGINISKELSYGIFMLIIIGIPFSTLMHTMLPLAVNEATKPPGKRLIDGIIILLSVVELGLFCTPLLMEYSGETHTIILGPLFPFANTLQMISISYSIVIIIILRKNITNTIARKYILTLIIIIAAFLPAIGYDQFLFTGVKSINIVPIEVILSPILYAVLSLVTLIFGIRILKTPVKLELSANAQIQETWQPMQPSLETKIHDLAESAGLSDREITIIPLISKGLGNKQIALELHISSKTVGNHIYNIYRKLNITSRYELLALLK